MGEKKEQLRLTKLRLKVLKKSTGQNIINFFQETNLKKEEENQKKDYEYSTESFEILSDDEFQIEQILMEAGAYGLKNEVKTQAEYNMLEASIKGTWLSKLDAYVKAYNKVIGKYE
jgi:hypothetical protein